MCGIIAYTGCGESYPILLKGLQRLAYRGYDSAGIALLNGGLKVYKKAGKVSNLAAFVENKNLSSHIGMGHTRWATHGIPNDINAHPHVSASGKLAVVHNGIIENYRTLQQALLNKGYSFKSDTDTEVLVTFIEDVQKCNHCSLEQAVRLALPKLIGAYAMILMAETLPNTLIAARKGSPMVIGIGQDELLIASDVTPIMEHTDQVVFIKDHEIAVVRDNILTMRTIRDVPLTPYIQKLAIPLATIEKDNFAHFMLKEIFEQPKAIQDCMRGRLDVNKKQLVLGGIRKHLDKLVHANKITIVACGTSWHAGLIAEYCFEALCRIPVEVEYASEFRYRKPIINQGDIVMAISQSGETADTLAAVELAKAQGATIVGICNVVASSLARSAQTGVYTHAGPEIGVASTKTFTAQLTVLMMMALKLAHQRGTITEVTFQALLLELASIPTKVAAVLQKAAEIQYIAHIFKEATNFLYLGRGYNFPIALEGALKLKEISYIHAEGYPAAEMKHGAIALIDEAMPVVFIATQDSAYEKICSNIEEIKARKGTIIAIVTQADKKVKQLANHVIEVPGIYEAFMPILSVIPLQLLAYYMAEMRGLDADCPRNLAKSVTVE